VLSIANIADRLTAAAGMQVEALAADVAPGADLGGAHPGEVTVAAGLAVEERPS
jgi:hypothetical protein